MVVLVRCKDNTCSVALKSRLNDLANDGLVIAYLRNGDWIAVETARSGRRICKSREQSNVLHAPLAAI